MQRIILSRDQARRIAISSQGLGSSRFGRGRHGARRAIEHLGYVQIDTISVVERAHHHTLWNRVSGYRNHHLDALIKDRSIFEYWSHAAAFLPMRYYRFCLPRMQAIAAGERHWYPPDKRLMRAVLARVRADGPLRAADFEAHTGTSGMWQWGPIKMALERLFMEGKLLVTRRDNFQKVFDLAERVIPTGTDTRMPSSSEHAHHLVDRYIAAHGIARTTEIGHLRRNRNAIQTAIDEQLESGQLMAVKIRGVDVDYIAGVDFEDRLSKRIPRQRALLLSPFDNLVIHRQRLLNLFDFDYRLECYVPKARRQYGYFCLPIIWRGRMVGRLDAKASRDRGVFTLIKLMLEPAVQSSNRNQSGIKKLTDLADAVCMSLVEFARYTGCRQIVIGDTDPPALSALLKQCVRPLNDVTVSTPSLAG